jgi:ParB-like chromosome segregation protein Spo0J
MLGLDKVPVRFVDLDPADARLMALADNKLGEVAEWDDGLLGFELSKFSLDDAALAGFDSEELDKLAGMLGVGELDAGDALGALPSGDREPFQQMTFTVHDSQAEIIKKALDDAKALGPFIGPNENSNGNALARICEAYRG